MNKEKTKSEYHFFYGGICSQWYMKEFTIGGTVYNCAEQYMMAMKAKQFGDEESLEKIMKTNHPREQKALGRKVKNFDADVWNDLARQYVYVGNMAKFTQNDDLKRELLETKGLLVEASPYDCIWGIGLGMTDTLKDNSKNWRGTNWLGEVLTDVRTALIED